MSDDTKILTMFLAILIFLALCVFHVFFSNKVRKGQKRPPSPGWRFPLLGHAPFLDQKQPFLKIDEWSKKLGDVMTVYFGNEPVVIVSRARLLHEAFLRQGSNFSGRPSLFVHESCWGKGLVIRDGPQSQRLRSFLLSAIRQQIQHSSSVQWLVTRETHRMVDRLNERILAANQTNKIATTNIEDDVFYVVGNVLTQIAYGRNFPHGSTEFKKNASWLLTTTQLMERTALITFLPWLRFIPYFKYYEMKDKAKEVHDNMMKEIKERRAAREYKDHSQMDIMSHFMRKIDDEEATGTADEMFSDDMLAMVMTELFFAGIQTECITFAWAFLYLSINEREQNTARQQIWQKVGRDGPILWEKRNELPFLEAVVAETQRMASIAPFGMFHKNHLEAELDGYTIPANSTVMMNLYSTLRDPEHFEDPEVFRPSRFLDEDGKMSSKKMKSLLPYGIGPRVCMGESIARCELFTVIGTLLQKFRFSLIPGREYSVRQELELTIRPQPYLLNIEAI